MKTMYYIFVYENLANNSEVEKIIYSYDIEFALLKYHECDFKITNFEITVNEYSNKITN